MRGFNALCFCTESVAALSFAALIQVFSSHAHAIFCYATTATLGLCSGCFRVATACVVAACFRCNCGFVVAVVSCR